MNSTTFATFERERGEFVQEENGKEIYVSEHFKVRVVGVFRGYCLMFEKRSHNGTVTREYEGFEYLYRAMARYVELLNEHFEFDFVAATKS